jgi:integrase
MAAVYDRWHKTHPKTDHSDPANNDQPCKCGRGKNKLYPTAEHEQGKRWQVRYTDDEGATPRKNFAELKGDNPEIHAEAFVAKIKSELDAGIYTDPKAGLVTLKAFATQWREGQVANLTTLIRLDSFLNIWIYKSAIANVPMGHLAKRPSLIQQWIKTMDDKMEATTVRWGVALLSSVFIAAIDDGIATRNPCRAKSIRLPTLSKEEVVPWTLEQVAAARKSLPGRYKAMADLGAGCGLRQGELFAIAKGDIDFLRRTVTVRRQIKVLGRHLVFALPKGEKVRTVPLPDSVSLALAAHLEEFGPVEISLPWEDPEGEVSATADLLFVWDRPRRQGAINRSTFNHLWRTARDAAGLAASRENGMHGLRHTFAGICLSQNVDIKTLSVWMGHSKPTITLDIYGHMMPKAEDKGRAAVDAFFAGGLRDENALEMPSGHVGSSGGGSQASVTAPGSGTSGQLSLVPASG